MTTGRARLVPLSATLALIAGCGSSSMTGASNQPPAPQANDVNIVVDASFKGAAAFDPNPKTVALAGAANGAIRWVNADQSSNGYTTVGVTHHIVSNDGTSFDTGEIGLNGAVSKTLPAGTYAYHCAIHPSMTGTITLTP